MNGTKEPDEILYTDEFHDEVSKPLTSTDMGVATPSIDLRAGFDSETDENVANNSRRPSFTETDIDEHDRKLDRLLPIGFDNRNGLDLYTATSAFSSSSVQVADVTVYQHRKTLAQGMMDLALLSANVNQMRYVLQTDGKHPYFYPSLIMISMSLFLQIAVGIGLIWNGDYDVKEHEQTRKADNGDYDVKEHEQTPKADNANNWTVIGIFLVTTLNVFISSFGVIDQTVAVTT